MARSAVLADQMEPEVSAASPAVPVPPAAWRQYRYYALGVLALIALLNTLDQSILSVTSPAIQGELGLADVQIGLLSGAFVLVYGLAALPAGFGVDRFSRRAIVGVGVGLWSLCTLLTGFAQSFPQLFGARTALGIGEATTVPATVSLLGDHFSKQERGRAAGVVQAALQLGLALGLIGGGIVAARLGWRSAFYLAAVPGLLLALVSLTMREPVRGSAEAVGLANPQPRVADARVFARLLRIRTFVAAALANAFFLFASTGVGGFVAIYTSRRFGVDLAQVGAMVGLPLLVGSLAGNTLGGWLVDWRGRQSARAHLEMALVASALCAVGLVATFNADSPSAFAICFLLATLAGNLGMPGLLAINQNLVIPPQRGSATAIQQLVSNLLGRAAGLVLIGVFSDQVHDLRLALLVLAPAALVIAAVCALVGMGSMPGDVAAMEREWQQAALRAGVEAGQKHQERPVEAGAGLG